MKKTVEQNLKIAALIPARGGSRGIPGKNLQQLAGKPLIVWTIEEAIKCHFIRQIVVSSESDRILKIASQYERVSILKRPVRLAKSKSALYDTIIHTLDTLKKAGENFDILALLQPTSPLRSAPDLTGAINQLLNSNARSIVSVCEAEHHPLWTNTLPENLSMENFIEASSVQNRQQLPVYYRLNGAIYLAYIDYLRKNSGFYGKETYAYIMPKERSIDIDSQLDMQMAELLIKKNEPE